MTGQTNVKASENRNRELPGDLRDRIVCGDSARVLRSLPENCIDLIVTSPPYNFGVEYDGYDDAASWKQYFRATCRVLRECVRVLKWGGRIALNIQPLYAQYVPTHHLLTGYLRSKGMI